MRFGIRTKLIIALEITVVFPILIFFAMGSSRSGGLENAFALILTQGILLIACTSVVSGIIIRSVLKPLDELHNATEKIMTGDLDYEIQYKKDNEMGRYCQAFEQMRVQLKESLQKQAALEQSRKELIASISHDLRTPLSSIRGYVEGLDDGIVHDEEKFKRYIAVIKNKTESLDSLIESLFQYSQMDIGKENESLCIRNSDELLESIISPFETEFIDNSINLSIARPFPSVTVSVDESRIAQVFDNLIGNAKRHMDGAGEITITVIREGDSLMISVTDDGSGISPEDLPHVFEQFYRAEKSRSRNYGGAGLGLAICKKIVESHGGRIWAESEPNALTTFRFVLPILKE
jgi:signal transduction histidine kinase